MKILRYLALDVLVHMVAVSFVLLVIIISGRFVKYLAEAAVGDLAAGILVPVLLYRLPGFMELIIPLGLFIGILMSYGRLYVESEMVIFTATGISPQRLAGYTLVPALLVMVIVGGLSLFISPLGAARSEALLHAPESSQGINALAAGRFQTRRSNDMVSYAQAVDANGVMHSVFLSQAEREDDGELTMLLTIASEGEVKFDSATGARYLELRNGVRYVGYPGDLDYQVVSFEQFGELIPEPEGGVRTADPVDGRTTAHLLSSELLEDKAALHWRLSIPVMVPIVAIIAMCMSHTNHRRGRYIKMAPAFILYLGYLTLLANARSGIASGEGGTVNIWAVHALFLAVALAMLYGPAVLGGLKHRRYLNAKA